MDGWNIDTMCIEYSLKGLNMIKYNIFSDPGNMLVKFLHFVEDPKL